MVLATACWMLGLNCTNMRFGRYGLLHCHKDCSEANTKHFEAPKTSVANVNAKGSATVKRQRKRQRQRPNLYQWRQSSSLGEAEIRQQGQLRKEKREAMREEEGGGSITY